MSSAETSEQNEKVSPELVYERIHGDIKVINTKYDHLSSQLDDVKKELKAFSTSVNATIDSQISRSLSPINSTIGEIKSVVDKLSEKTGTNMIDIAKVLSAFTLISAVVMYIVYRLINVSIG